MTGHGVWDVSLCVKGTLVWCLYVCMFVFVCVCVFLFGGWLVPRPPVTIYLDTHVCGPTQEQAGDDERNPDAAAEDGGGGGGGGRRRKRVTLLVNVWLNHLPNSAERPGACGAMVV
jgi:hypothetical protein